MKNTTTGNNEQVVARAVLPSPTDMAVVDDVQKRAVSYVRVSTSQQVNRDRDGGDGFSIPAQIEACKQKSSDLGATLVAEFVDRGESARKADRPRLQAMLEYIATNNIDYVICHKVDRIARNRLDDAQILFEIRQAGAQLVSVSEGIDGTPAGMMMHGVLATMAEYFSNNHGTEVKKGLTRKAQQGGTIGRAPIGYLNKADLSGGGDVRWVEPDPERADHIRWAFSAYASGRYTLRDLTAELANRGLTTMPTQKRPQRPLYVSNVHKMLTNPYYVGILVFKGAHYPGRHEALVDIEQFTAVQTLLGSRRQGEKTRNHPHYLKSTIYCDRCGSRYGFTRSTGNGGAYDYFFCHGRRHPETNCDQPFLDVDKVEAAIVDHYESSIELDAAIGERLADEMWKALKDARGVAESDAKTQRKRITSLKNRQQKLIDGYEFGGIPIEQLRERQGRIEAELQDANRRIHAAEQHWDDLERNLRAAVRLASECSDAYRVARNPQRRLINQAIATKIFVGAESGTDAVVGTTTELAQPFEKLLDPKLHERLAVGTRPSGSRSWGHGVKEVEMVGDEGLEPPTSSV